MSIQTVGDVHITSIRHYTEKDLKKEALSSVKSMFNKLFDDLSIYSSFDSIVNNTLISFNAEPWYKRYINISRVILHINDIDHNDFIVVPSILLDYKNLKKKFNKYRSGLTKKFKDKDNKLYGYYLYLTTDDKGFVAYLYRLRPLVIRKL